MKKYLAIITCLAIVFSMGCATANEPKSVKELFKTELPNVLGSGTLYDRFSAVKKMDLERFINSGQGEALLKSYALQIKYKDGSDPEVIKYWKDKGIKKIIFGGQNKYVHQYVAYVPVEALEEDNTKKFPLIFNLPHANLFQAEGRGYAELAAKERLIVVIPSATNIEELMRLYVKMTKVYPVDKSRFYMTGFSYTGFRTTEFAMRHPEVVAGIAINSHFWPFMWEMPEPWIVDRLAKLNMPIVKHVGNVDFGVPVPINKPMDDKTNPKGKDHLHTAEENIDRANMWFKINNVPQVSYQQAFAAAKSKNKVEREIGVPVSRSKIEKIDGTEYFYGDFKSKDGVYRTRIISMDNIPHYVFGSMAEVTWDFLKHFQRDPVTKQSLTNNEVPL